MFGDRRTRVLIGLGVILVVIACFLPTRDRFVGEIGTQRAIITRQDNPVQYWGTNAGIAVAGISLFAAGIYRGRKK